MKRGQDIAIEVAGLYLVHHNLPGKEVDPHSHPEHLLFLPLQGEIGVDLGDRTLRAGPGRMIYLPPGTSHAFASSGRQGERLIALIAPGVWKRAGAAAFGPGNVAANQLCKEILFYLLLHPRTRHGAALVATLVHALEECLEASCHLLDTEHLEGKIRDERGRKTIRYLREHLADTFSMNELAENCGLSVRTLNRIFAVELGLAPKQVLAQLRVSRATELLLSGGRSVTEVAYEVGYQSLPRFISVFRQLTGQLPSEVARRGLGA